ncbi:MAG TPA: hypothetical protein VLF15_01895 [Pseudoxanthomonas sp.]|nr:hypothetical protein [Pseudoxanthomonas sp.]
MPSFITHQPGRILRRARHGLVLFVFARLGIPVPADPDTPRSAVHERTISDAFSSPSPSPSLPTP